jgi:hypothetical protein
MSTLSIAEKEELSEKKRPIMDIDHKLQILRLLDLVKRKKNNPVSLQYINEACEILQQNYIKNNIFVDIGWFFNELVLLLKEYLHTDWYVTDPKGYAKSKPDHRHWLNDSIKLCIDIINNTPNY